LNLVDEILKLGVKRLRISSIEPREVTQDLLDFLKEHDEVFCDHFHMPLQSGSDFILKRMGRRYDTAKYYEVLCDVRNRFPRASISADVIPGFPGETEEYAEETIRFIKKCSLSFLHVFPYSKRPNTRALRMPGHLSPEVISKRATQLRALSQQLQGQYNKMFIGETLSVLWEKSYDSKGRIRGKTPNYLSVVCADDKISPKTISQANLKGFVDKNTILVTLSDSSE